jgi:hypothetical protein
MIKNRTGELVMYWFPETDKEQPKYVNPGEDIPFKESLFKVPFRLLSCLLD